MKARSMTLEMCVDSVASAWAAEQGGATRIELCSGLREGGLTPSLGLIRAVRANVALGLHVMIRPRSGDFCFSAEEFAIMRDDIDFARQSGADGVVLGILTPDGEIDIERTRELVRFAQPMEVTFHRAIDLTSDIARSLEDVIQTGAVRVLTSGAERDAAAGSARLRQLVDLASGRITIMAGGGIRLENARQIAQDTGVCDFHSGFARMLPSPSFRHLPDIALGDPDVDEHLLRVVLPDDVRELRAALDATPEAAPGQMQEQAPHPPAVAGRA